MSTADLNAIHDLRLNGLSGEIRDAAEFTRSIIAEHHVPADLFERCRMRWETNVLVDLASLIGYYSFLAMVINAFDDAPPPRIEQGRLDAASVSD